MFLRSLENNTHFQPENCYVSVAATEKILHMLFPPRGFSPLSFCKPKLESTEQFLTPSPCAVPFFSFMLFPRRVLLMLLHQWMGSWFVQLV